MFGLAFARIISYDVFYNSDVNVKAAHNEFVINYVFHNVRLFLLAEIYSCVAQSYIAEIILKRRVYILSAFNIVSRRLADKESVQKIVDISRNSFVRYIYSVFTKSSAYVTFKVGKGFLTVNTPKFDTLRTRR